MQLPSIFDSRHDTSGRAHLERTCGKNLRVRVCVFIEVCVSLVMCVCSRFNVCVAAPPRMDLKRSRVCMCMCVCGCACALMCVCGSIPQMDSLEMSFVCVCVCKCMRECMYWCAYTAVLFQRIHWHRRACRKPSVFVCTRVCRRVCVYWCVCVAVLMCVCSSTPQMDSLEPHGMQEDKEACGA